MNRKFNWRDGLRLAEFVVILVAAIFAYQTLKDAAKGISEQLTATFNDDVTNENSTGIIAAIDQSKPILIENGGHFDDYHLDNYLGIYEVMDGAYLRHQIDQEDFCGEFSYYLQQTKNSKEINDYIQKVRKDYKEPNFYTGFEELASKSLKDCK